MVAMLSPVSEGYVNLDAGRIWYKVVGSGTGFPLLTVHGGPGYPHDYLETLHFLASDRPVIFYDQLGCGNSDALADPSLWNLPRFVDELAALRNALDWPAIHLYGHSWGTLIVLEYLLAKHSGVVSATLASPAISIPRWADDTLRLCAGMPDGFHETIERHLRLGTTGSDEYQTCCMEFYRRHLCRLDPWPECMQRSFLKSGSEVYEAMWGPSEFHPTGTLKGYDRTTDLASLSVPVLYTCGQHDEASPETCRWYQSLTPGSSLAVFEQSSHMPHLEQPDRYLTVLRSFLAETERHWLQNPKAL
jgi:proline iminopeptidase